MNTKLNRRLFLVAASVALVGTQRSWAQFASTGVSISGEIERITINDPADHWSGGTIQVGGQSVILPRNLLIDLPANRLTLKQLYDEAPAACLATGETGLAKADACNTSGTGGFITLSANHTSNGNIIAGDVLIQKGIEVVTGTVSYIDYTDGYYRLNGNPGDPTTGVMVRLNDPTGRHTVQQGLGCSGGPNCSPDPRFALDPDNYTNTFTTGYPYGIPSTVPRTITTGLPALPGPPAVPAVQAGTIAQADANGAGDKLCPQGNRPATGAVADSRLFAPIRLGDSVVAEGNFETVSGVRFLSAHSSTIQSGLVTSQADGQPDYMFLDEVEIDMPAWQNERIRTLIIGYTTFAPADVMIWSLHYDPMTNTAHEFPLASVTGCDGAAGPGTCGSQGLVANRSDIFKIRHDVDFLAGADPKLNPCSHLQGDPRMGAGFCPNGGGSPATTAAVLADQMSILSPIPHEIQARTGRKWASERPGFAGRPLVTLDINGKVATNGQYLFPFGMNLGGIATVEPVEFDLNAVAMPFFFSALPWAMDRRLSPDGCIDTTGDGLPDCEATPQPLDPFPFEALDPRIQAVVPNAIYTDPHFTASPLADSRNRMFSFVGGGGNFNGNSTVLAWPPLDPPLFPIDPTLPVFLTCSSDTGGGTGNTTPVARPDSAVATVGVPVTVLVLANDSDADGNALRVTAAGPVTNGTVTFNANSVTYTANATGAASFPYTISDGSLTASSTVTVGPPENQPPVATGQAVAATSGVGKLITLAANDADGPQPLTFAIATPPANGTLTGLNTTTGAVTYTSNTGFTGTDTFTFTAADGLDAVSAPATVTLDVTAAATDTVVIVAATWRIGGTGNTGKLSIAATSTRGPAAVLIATLRFANGTVSNLGVMSSVGGVNYTLNRAAVPNPTGATVTVTSSLGGSASLPVTIR